MDVEIKTRSGRPIVENVDKIIEIIESDRNASTYSIAQKLKISQKTVWNHLHGDGGGDWRWKMGHIREQQAKKIVVQGRWAGLNDRQARING